MLGAVKISTAMCDQKHFKTLKPTVRKKSFDSRNSDTHTHEKAPAYFEITLSWCHLYKYLRWWLKYSLNPALPVLPSNTSQCLNFIFNKHFTMKSMKKMRHPLF